VSARRLVTLPERLVRSAAAIVGGAVHETAQVVLPRFVRQSRVYEATAKNVLRITIELVGELKDNGVLARDAEIASVDQLLGVLERGAGKSAALIDVPPMELKELRSSIAELAAERKELPGPDELQSLYEGLVRQARAENRSLLAVSSGIGLAFLNSAQHVGREHVWVPYREDWQPLREEGFAAYARRVAQPYRDAVEGHFDAAKPTLTERLLARVRGSKSR
jgi:hypothetical protein